jgi:hypothetical protein
MPSIVESIVEEQKPESLHLEFKRSTILSDRRTDDICKAVSAMANSDGGTLVFGVAEDKEAKAYNLDGGISDPHRATEWLDNILSDNIAPRIQDLKISSVEIDGATYITLDVPKSFGAPHQSSDKRFYKRSNNRSFPMEAYEIDDVRGRRSSAPAPLVVDFGLDRGVFANVVVFNRSEFVCRDLKVRISSNFKMNAFGKNNFGEISLSRVGVGQRTEYILGTIFEILSETADATFRVEGSYFSEVSDKPIQFSDSIHIGELKGTAIAHDASVEQLKKIGDEIRGARDEIKKAASINEGIAETISGSGIRISPFSLFQFKRPPEDSSFASFKYDGYGLTLQGMAEILEVAPDVVSELYRCFQYYGGRQEVDKALEMLPKEVADRFRQRISFDR